MRTGGGSDPGLPQLPFYLCHKGWIVVTHRTSCPSQKQTSETTESQEYKKIHTAGEMSFSFCWFSLGPALPSGRTSLIPSSAASVLCSQMHSCQARGATSYLLFCAVGTLLCWPLWVNYYVKVSPERWVLPTWGETYLFILFLDISVCFPMQWLDQWLLISFSGHTSPVQCQVHTGSSHLWVMV